MMKADVLVIGSSAAGLVAAITAKRSYPDKRVMVVTKQPQTMVPCGIPYVFGSLESTASNLIPVEQMFAGAGVDVLHEEATLLDRDKRRVTLASGEEIEYDRLVIGTGSLPRKVTALEGADLENVFFVPKDKAYIDRALEQLKDCRKVVVVGAGFIGLEVSDELCKAGKAVCLVEYLPHVLGRAFDEDVARRVETLITERGVELRTGVGVDKIAGSGKVSGVELSDGSSIEADAVIVSIGYQPNVDLAREAGLPISPLGFIHVDEYMRTEDPQIFAVGDCAEKRDFVTRKPVAIMLASTACAEARIAGMNLFGLSVIKTFKGTISIFSTAIGDTGLGIAGLTEKIAEQENFKYVTGVFEGVDHHPGTLAGTHKQFVKLVVGKDAGVILGGEVYGGLSVGELINTIGVIVQSRMTVNDLLTLQLGTHPLLTASPAGYPLIKAAEDAAIKMR
jgi:NADPH-dependent 2,4-dienoyl-CoA reductase/sulfur reductase-like enzyme